MPIRVLMIDDDARLVEMLGGYLRAHGYVVDCCGDGESGLQAQRRSEYDAVILDVMLPGIDGLEVCRRMRAFSQVPIVMLTARGDDMDRIVGIEIGADDYLAKPFNPRELLARLAAVLRRTQVGERQAADRLRVGPLEIDRGSPRDQGARPAARVDRPAVRPVAVAGGAGRAGADARPTDGGAQGRGMGQC